MTTHPERTIEQRAEDFSRFMQMVLIGSLAGDCWGFTGTRPDGRYGHFSVNGQTVKAHRWIYELLHGPIPEGLILRHRCDEPSCVNPMHLEIGTSAQNTQDIIERGRWPDRSGEKHPMAVLNAEKVRRIRHLATLGYTQHWIAEQCGISKQHVGKIVRRECWDHV